MDATHQQHLARILENRRRRGLPDPRSSSDARSPSIHQPPPPVTKAVLPSEPSAAPTVSEAAAAPLSETRPPLRTGAEPKHPPRPSSAAPGKRTFATINFGAGRGLPAPRMPAAGGGNGAAARDLYEELAARRGAFSDFHNHPAVSAASIAPLHSGGGGDEGTAPAVGPQQHPHAHAAHTGAVARTAVVEPRVSQPNPFRVQTYENFVQAPNYSTPQELQALSPDPHMGARAQQALDLHVVGENTENAVFDIRQSIFDLRQGDWFMKWTSKRDKVHRRYFWLDTDRGCLFWAKSAGASVLLSSSIRVEEIAEIQTSCVVDDASGKTLYILLIVCVARLLQIGTELRDKFDKWHDALVRLSTSQRQYNSKFYGRYTTAPPRKNALEQHLQQQQFAANPSD